MRRIATLAFLLALAGVALAAGPDDDFLVIYTQIQRADALQKGGQLPAAATEYLHAREALQKLHADFPAANAAAVTYRLDYLADKLKELAPYLPSANAGAAAPKPAVPLTPQQQAAMWQEEISALTKDKAELEMKLKDTLSAQQQAAMLQERIGQLTNANARLEMKLKEALSVQPAAVAPDELAKARARITDLEKERDLLKVTLEQQKAAKPGAKPSASNADADKLKAVEKERDDLKKQIAAMKPGPPPQRATASAAGSSAELESLRARLAVLEAAAVPYTAEELAVLKSSPSAGLPAAPLAAKELPSKAHSVKDLSFGLVAIMRQARGDAEARRYADAEKEYLQVLRQDENNVDVLYYLGHVQFAAGRLDDCEKTVHRALALAPNDPGNLYLLGILRYGQEKLDDALDALSRSAALNSTNAATQFSLGSVLAAKGLRAEAQTAFRKALEIDPAFADAHFNLALVYAAEKPPSLALARWHYQKAVDDGHEKSDKLEKMLAEGK